MKFLASIFLFSILTFFTSLWNDFMHIYRSNKAITKADKAYKDQDFQTSVNEYFYLTDVLKETDPKIQLDMAQSYFRQQDTLALAHYAKLVRSENAVVRSIANNQLGILKATQMGNIQGKPSSQEKQKDYMEQAINHFADAMRAHASNDIARYNYELLKRIKEQQQQQNKQDKKDDKKDQKKDQKEQQQKQDQQDKKDQQKKEDQKKQDQQKKEGEQEKKEQQQQNQQKSEEQKKKEQMESVSKELKKMKMTPEKAEMLLNAMKNAEKQYLQQNRRKATQKSDPNKPDW